jgi:hypothetical protein
MNKKEFLTDEELEELLDLQTEIFDVDAVIDFCNTLVEISPEDMTNAPLHIKLIWFVRCSFLEGFRRGVTVVNDALKDDDSDCDSEEV